MTKTELAAKQYSKENVTKDVSIKEAFEDGAADMLERVLKYLEYEHPTFFDNFGEEIKFAMEE